MTDLDNRRFYRSGVALAVGGTFLFALKSIFIKLAYAEGADTEVLLTLRMLMALPFYIGMWVYLRHQSAVSETLTRGRVLRVLATGLLGYYLASFLDLKGLEYISAQLERLTLFTYPAMISLLAWLFLGERITRQIIFALVMCYLGIFMMYWKEQQLFSGTDIALGVALVMGSALSFSLYVLFSKPVMMKIGSRMFTSIAMVGSTFFVLMHFLFLRDVAELKVSAIIYWYAALLAFVSTVIPSFMVSEAIVRIGAARTTILGSAGPVFTMALAVVLLAEPTSVWHLLGTVLVISGVFAVSRQQTAQ